MTATSSPGYARGRLRDYWEDVRGLDPFVPLARITEEGQVHGTYRYRYAPLLLVALERRAGGQRVGRALGRLVERAREGHPSPRPGRADFRAAARAAGIDAATLDAWEAEGVERPRGTAASQSSCPKDRARTRGAVLGPAGFDFSGGAP